MSGRHQHLGTVPALTAIWLLSLAAWAVAAPAASAPTPRPNSPTPTPTRPPAPPPPPGILMFLDRESSGEGFAEHLEKVGQEVRLRLPAKGFPATDLFRADSAATRRALTERAISDRDLKRLDDLNAIARLCLGLTRRIGLVLSVARVTGSAAQVQSIDVRLILIDAAGGRQERMGVLTEASELVADRRGALPALTAMAGQKVADQVAKQIQQWPPMTAAANLAHANDLANRAESRAAAADLVGALELITQALSLAPREARLYRLAGEFSERLGELATAVVQYRRALTINADEAATHLKLAQLLARQNDLLEAARSARSAIQLGSDSAEARRILAAALLARREAVFATRPEEAKSALDEAIKHLRRAAELQPADLDLAARLGSMLMEARQFNEAIEPLTRVVRASPGDDAAREQLAHALYQARRYDEAFEEFRQVLTARPWGGRLAAETYRRVAFLLDRRAVQIFQEARNLLEELEAGRRGREQALSRLEQIREAANLVTELLGRLTPSTAQAAALAHRKLAFTFFDQALAAYLMFLDTDDSLYRDRGMVLQTQAATEYDLARARPNS